MSSASGRMVKRAEVDADVPEGILPKRDYLEKQLALQRAGADLARAEDALTSQRVAAAADVKLKRIAVEKLRRAAAIAEEAIATLTLRSTEAGTVIIHDHPEERRKLQEADDVFMGMTVARVSSGNGRRVRAWLSDVDDGKIAPGMAAKVVLDAHPDRRFTGTVRDISPVARSPGDPRAQRRVFTVNVDLAEVDAAVLRPGLSARVEVMADRRAKALLAPRAAIAWTSEGPRARLQDGSEVGGGPGRLQPRGLRDRERAGAGRDAGEGRAVTSARLLLLALVMGGCTRAAAQGHGQQPRRHGRPRARCRSPAAIWCWRWTWPAPWPPPARRFWARPRRWTTRTTSRSRAWPTKGRR